MRGTTSSRFHPDEGTRPQAGVYNLCSLSLGKGATIEVPALGPYDPPVKIYIDSSQRPGSPTYTDSGCSARDANSGAVLNAAQGVFVNQAGSADKLQVYVYGGAPNTGQDVTFNAATANTAAIYAPQSKVKFASGASMTGALAAREVDFQNNGDKVGFVWDANASKVLKPSPGDYRRRGWRECRPEPSVVGDPESGC